jgi:hypothetical protein
MKKFIAFIIFINLQICFGQENTGEKKCYYFKIALSGKDRFGWTQGHFISKSGMTASECQTEFSKATPERYSNDMYKWEKVEVIKPCKCTEVDKPAKSKSNPSSKPSSKGTNLPPVSKSGPKLKPNDAAIMNSMSNTLYNNHQSAIDEKNRRNEQNSNRFEGGRPSSQEAFNLPTLKGSSSSDAKTQQTTDNQNEVMEFDSDDDGIIDTRRISVSGKPPVYEKLESQRPSAAENYYLDEFDGSSISSFADIAESLGSDTYSSLGIVGDALSDLSDIKKLKNFYDHPKNSEAAIDVTTALGSRMASALSRMSGMMFDKFAAPIPVLFNDVTSSSLEQGISLLQNGTYDEKEVWRSLGNYYGNGIGMGNIGDRAIGFTNEGDKSWDQLKSEYGFFDGTKKAVWYYLLNDLNEKKVP